MTKTLKDEEIIGLNVRFLTNSNPEDFYTYQETSNDVDSGITFVDGKGYPMVDLDSTGFVSDERGLLVRMGDGEMPTDEETRQSYFSGRLFRSRSGRGFVGYELDNPRKPTDRARNNIYGGLWAQLSESE